MIKVNGYKLRELIKESALELATINTTFEESLYKFADENKPNPVDLMDQIVKLEKRVAALQAAQSDYNLKVKVEVEGKQHTLEYAIKLVGGAGRASKRWREAAKGEKLERYERRQGKERDKDKEYTVATVSKADALQQAKNAEKFASRLRNAIALGNLTDIEYDDSVALLFA